MSTNIMQKVTSMKRLFPIATAAALMFAAAAHAAAPGITGPTFNLTAQAAFINQPDGNQVYSWGYGCNGAPTGFAPSAIAGAACPTMQIPAPTLIVTQGQAVTVTLTNNLPTSAGNTSILFPGFTLTSTCAAANQGLLACEALPGGSVTYTFTATSPGTRAYYSGTQGDLQVEMGLYGAIIVLPSTMPANCTTGLAAANLLVEAAHGEPDFRLANASGGVGAAYNHPDTCYDREYLFQFSEMDINIHRNALAQVSDPKRILACAGGATAMGCPLEVPTEPYRAAYFLINGRSMPDDMDPNYDAPYPHQPYNGNPHMHPGELTLLRVVGQGRMEHPFHEHANHVRILARDGNPIISSSATPLTYGASTGATTVAGQALAGLLMFTTDTFPGQTFDGIFYFTGRGLNWDMYAHNPTSNDPTATLPCSPNVNGYNTVNSPIAAPVGAINYFEGRRPATKPSEPYPRGEETGGGPMTLPAPNIFANGAWYGGSPYLG